MSLPSHKFAGPPPYYSWLQKIINNREDWKWCTPLCSTQTLQRCCVLYKCYTLSWHTCKHKYNFIYTHKKPIAFTAPAFEKLINAQQHHLQIAYIEFHLRSYNKCGMYGEKFINTLKRSMGSNALIFTKVTTQYIAVGIPCTEI